MSLWHNQNMHRRFWVNIFDCNKILRLQNNFRRKLFFNYLAKNAIFTHFLNSLKSSLTSNILVSVESLLFTSTLSAVLAETITRYGIPIKSESANFSPADTSLSSHKTSIPALWSFSYISFAFASTSDL